MMAFRPPRIASPEMLPSVGLLPHVICSPPVFGVVAERYARSTRKDRGRILDEFGALTGLHRKHAMRLLRGGTHSEQSGRRLRRRVYDDAVSEALAAIGPAARVW
jgi:hypothetical protein